MIRLKNKPDGCKNCPFCYKEDRCRYIDSGVEHYQRNYCGVLRDDPEGKECPLR